MNGLGEGDGAGRLGVRDGCEGSTRWTSPFLPMRRWRASRAAHVARLWSARSTIGPIEPVAKYERSVAQSGSFAWASRRAAVVGVSVVT